MSMIIVTPGKQQGCTKLYSAQKERFRRDNPWGHNRWSNTNQKRNIQMDEA